MFLSMSYSTLKILTIFFFIIIVFFLIIMYYGYYYKKSFWKHQPVNHFLSFHNKNQIIKPINDPSIKHKLDLDLNITLDKNINKNIVYEFSNISDIHHFTDFIKKHYIKNKYYTKDEIEYILNSPNPTNTNFHISLIEHDYTNSNDTKSEKIIGSIIGRPFNVKLNGQKRLILYVDFLCIHSDYRNKRLAPKLISQMVLKMIESKIDVAFFKIDNKPLPFHVSSNFNYFTLSISDINFTNIRNENIKMIKYHSIENNTNNEKINRLAYQYFKNFNSEFYPDFSFQDFDYHFNSNQFQETYIFFDKFKTINGLIQIQKSKYHNPDLFIDENIIEIIYHIKSNKIKKHLIHYIPNLKYQYDKLLFLNSKYNNQLFKNYYPIKYNKTHYQFYNYITNIDNNQIDFFIS